MAEVAEMLGLDVPAHRSRLLAAGEGDSYQKLWLLHTMFERGARAFRTRNPTLDPESGTRVIDYVVAELDRMLAAGFGPAADEIAGIGFNPRTRRVYDLPEGLAQLDAAGALRVLELGASAKFPSSDSCIAVASAYLHEHEPDIAFTTPVTRPDGTLEFPQASPAEIEAMKYWDAESLGHGIGRELGLKFQPDRAFELWHHACVAGLPPPWGPFKACEGMYWKLMTENAFGLGPRPELAESYRTLGIARQASIDEILKLSEDRRWELADEERYEMDRKYLEGEIADAKRMALFGTALETLRNSMGER